MESGAAERALILGWDARELIGLHRAKPHDHPARAPRPRTPPALA
jgi:hypothetical protein